MKVKTSVSLSEQLLCEIDREIGEDGNRSQFIEKALKRYFRLQRKAERDAHDAAIYRKYGERMNAEAADLLDYQVDPFELGDDVEILADEVELNGAR
jgi:metal-responsive CopG/Arc/MetJ family transcriptional regulator